MTLRVGIQMYSVRDELAADPIATIRAVIAMGYQNLEFANLTTTDPGVGFAADPSELREVIEADGGTVLSTHLQQIDPERIDDVIAFHRELGTKYLVSKLLYRNLDDIDDIARNINRLGEKMADVGIQQLVHTSLFRSHGDRTDLDELLTRLAPEYRNLELDTYWVHRSGLDVVQIIERYGEWIRVLHQKDLPFSIRQPVNIIAALPADAPLVSETYYQDERYVSPDNFTEIGAGILPLQQTIDAAIEHTDANYILVEQDWSSQSGLKSVEQSIAALLRTNGVTL
ncbi:sugar phosphate isomerase/epimerase family protein [Subtercola frigoramans]|uniref:Sugar phosphate isomerase/epimerase n=1 Tax=Subtercola frigoramans TaxID=120298 RepID=A0ABS2L743_9MICO|nr:TIM barrel protein [Subtercola frigoramans]MBM7472903.1 sugar phosphate isomerase/epimerase [Subtercola frigoramans]